VKRETEEIGLRGLCRRGAQYTCQRASMSSASNESNPHTEVGALETISIFSVPFLQANPAPRAILDSDIRYQRNRCQRFCRNDNAGIDRSMLENEHL
jgi:hypothetical protein